MHFFASQDTSAATPYTITGSFEVQEIAHAETMLFLKVSGAPPLVRQA